DRDRSRGDDREGDPGPDRRTGAVVPSRTGWLSPARPRTRPGRQRRDRRGGLPAGRPDGTGRGPRRHDFPGVPRAGRRRRDAPPPPRAGHDHRRGQRERRRVVRGDPGRCLRLLRQGRRRAGADRPDPPVGDGRVRHQRATPRQALRRRPRPGPVPQRDEQFARPDECLRPPDRAGARHPAQRQRRDDQRRDRLRPRDQRPDGQEPRHVDPAQAGRQRPHPGGRDRPAPGVAVDRRPVLDHHHTSTDAAVDRAPLAQVVFVVL
ncbi:MAG: Two-component transcriptional response regulator, LuxR family, partial [uncultured Thermomicrobiales bacterium]